MPLRRILSTFGLDDQPDASPAPAAEDAEPAGEATPTDGDSETRQGTPAARRRARRTPIRGLAALSWEDGPSRVFGGLLNISQDGCLIKTEASLEEGTRVELELDFVGGPVEDANAQAEGIVRHRTEVDGRQAYGVEFVDEDDQRAELLAIYSDALT